MKNIGIQTRLLEDPLYSQKNPHQTFLLLATIAATGPVLIGGRSPSEVMRTNVDGFGVYLWTGILFLGSVIALIAEFRKGNSWQALVMERVGLFLVGAGAACYAFVVWRAADELTSVGYIVGVTSAYAASSLWRVGQITIRLRWIRRLVAEVNSAAEQ